MILQNIIWDGVTEATKELYYRGCSIECFGEKIVIDSGSSFRTDTYMNLLDVKTWRKYTLIHNVVLKIELSGRGRIVLRTLEQSVDKVVFPFECEKRKEFLISIPNEWNGKIYFEIVAGSKIEFYRAYYQTEEPELQVAKLAIVICTYRREQSLKETLQELEKVKSALKDTMEVFVVDNASELEVTETSWIHLYHNPNTGGSGGFSRGMDEVANYYDDFEATHVLLMDDDVVVQSESILRLFTLLSYMKAEYGRDIVAGRMFRLDKPWVQYTAAEIWNGGDLRHIGFELDMNKKENLRTVNDNLGAEYSGWWFCCIPYSFVKDNRPLPFFLHCDDVEYGLRHGGTPIILNGIQVWHETYEYRQSPVMAYYDMRNSLFVNELLKQKNTNGEMNNFYLEVLRKWRLKILQFHLKKDWIMEYCVIIAFYDWLKGKERLKKINGNQLHQRLTRMKSSRLKNAFARKYIEYRFKRKFLRR